tara:strand:- start:2559 stop:3059 length:501 start_codon:yes stop_codon:yes gene_type:complete
MNFSELRDKLKYPSIIKAPNSTEFLREKAIFLAGSIEMGKAVDWQTDLTKDILKDHDDVTLLNPRRSDWDSSWEQKIENKQFREQVEWELAAMDKADIIIMYFAPDTQSPISLLELGLHAQSDKLIVYCPEGFWRKGNVDVLCNRYNIKQVSSFEEMRIEIAKGLQ